MQGEKYRIINPDVASKLGDTAILKESYGTNFFALYEIPEIGEDRMLRGSDVELIQTPEIVEAEISRLQAKLARLKRGWRDEYKMGDVVWVEMGVIGFDSDAIRLSHNDFRIDVCEPHRIKKA